MVRHDVGVAGTASSLPSDRQADLLDLNDPEPAPTGAAPPPAGGNNGMQDLLGDALATVTCMLRLFTCNMDRADQYASKHHT